MQHRRIAGWVLSVLISGLLAVPVSAQPLADRVPDDALIFISWSGSQNMGPGYAGSHLQAMVEASDFSRLVSESIPRLLQKVGAKEPQVNQIAGLVSAIGGPMWRNPSAFYFGGIEMREGAPPLPKFALLCNAGQEAGPMADLLKQLLANARPPYPINVEQQGGLVMVSAGAQGWGAGQKPANPLIAGARFKAAVAQVHKESVGAFYVDVEGILALVDRLIQRDRRGAEQWLRIKDAIGLGGIRRVIGTAGFDGKDWSCAAFIDAPAPRTGVLPALLDSKPLSEDILKVIPQSATLAAAGKFNLGQLVANVRSAIGKIEPRATENVDAFFAQAKEQLGVDLVNDFANAFGDEWALYVDPQSGGSGLLSCALVNKLKDPVKLEASMTKLEGVLNQVLKQNVTRRDGPIMEFKQSSVGTLKLHYFAIPVVTPTWAIADGNLYIALYPQIVQAAAEHVSTKGRSILENADFQAMQKRLGVKSPTSVSFANLPLSAPDAYGQMLLLSRAILGMGDLFGADTPPMVLPPLKKIMAHLAPAGGASWVDEQGWHFKSVEPFPGSQMLTPGIGGQMMIGQTALLTSILLPSLTRAREQANRVKCMSNMRQIGMGIMMYANENKGKFPADLGTLMSMDLTPEVFVCPAGHSGTLPPRGNAAETAAWINANSAYVYLPQKRVADMPRAAETVILYEKPHNHRGQGVNMLFGDAHVEWMPMPSARQVLEKQGVQMQDGH